MKTFHTIYLCCIKVNETTLRFEIASQQGKGTTPSSLSELSMFWISQHLTFTKEYDRCIFTFYNGTTQLFAFENVGKEVNNTDVSQQNYITIPATITI